MLKGTKKAIKGYLALQYQKYLDDRYHQEHFMEADKSLKNIEKSKGKTDPRIIKLCDEYAVDVFGWRGYAPWLYFYGAVCGSFKEGWIPDNYYGKVVVPRMKGLYGDISGMKPVSNLLFRGNHLPDLGCFVNGIFYNSDLTPLAESHVSRHLFSDTDRILFKVDSSLRGQGIFFFDKETFDIDKLKSLGNGVFQSYIVQHEVFSNIISSSVATMRMTTVIDNSGNPSLRACYLRLGYMNDTHVTALQGVRIPININTGNLSDTGFLADLSPVDRHPDTNARFSGLEVPEFSKCVATVLELHGKFPYARCVGWDITVDRDNDVKVMEWNGRHNDIKFGEAMQGPCFSDLGWENLRQQPS